MKKTLVLLLAAVTLLLAGCGSAYHPAKPVGEVPAEFLPLIESGLLQYGCCATANGILAVSPTDADGDDRTDSTEFVKYDKYGAELARVQIPRDALHNHRLKALTSDDGFLLVNAYSNDPAYGEEDPKLADVSSDIVKFDRLCNIEWTLPMPECDWFALHYCFETPNGWVFFGVRETGETYSADSRSSSEIYIVLVSFAGEIAKTVTFSGSRHDHLYCVVPQDDGFVLYLGSDSNDGDFAHKTNVEGEGRTYWIFRLDNDLQCVSKEVCSHDDYYDYFEFVYRSYYVGYLDGKALRSNDALFADCDGGEVLAVLDYDTFYLVVFRNKTGDGAHPGGTPRSWWTTETVYTAFGKDGEILWRTAVDDPYIY